MWNFGVNINVLKNLTQGHCQCGHRTGCKGTPDNFKHTADMRSALYSMQATHFCI